MEEMIGEILIWISLVFASGSVLLLERHCLGQRALVQPLVMCLLVGLVTENLEIALWLGVTLQLLSVSPIRAVDWSLAGAVSAMTLALASRLGANLEVGGPSGSLLIMLSIVAGTFARSVECAYARKDSARVRTNSPWSLENPAWAVERIVYRAITRWIIVGGVEALLGVGLSILFIMAASFLPPSEGWVLTVSAVGCPIFGVAVAISALSETRFFAWSGISMGLSAMLFWLVIV